MRVNSIRLLINETKKCLESECDLSALIVALTIPDVCGKVLFPKNRTSERYKKWFDKYIGDYEQSPFEKELPVEERVPYMNGEVFYKSRCAMLHEGSDDIARKIHADEFNLMLGEKLLLGSTEVTSQRVEVLDDGSKKVRPKVVVWNVNVRDLCEKIIWAAEAFLKKEVKDSKDVPTIQVSEAYAKRSL